MPYEYGQIVLVPVTDGHGNIKLHPAVILSPSEQTLPEAELRVVCVSTQVEDPCPPHHVPLPWQRPRHPKTVNPDTHKFAANPGNPGKHYKIG